MRILGIDPGPKESGVCLLQSLNPVSVDILHIGKINEADLRSLIIGFGSQVEIAMEGMVHQGRGFGQSCIETCYLIGRIQELVAFRQQPITLYSRREYGRWFVTDGTLNDASLRAALEQIYGPSAKKGDPLYALRGASDKRSAFALAKYHEFKLGIK